MLEKFDQWIARPADGPLPGESGGSVNNEPEYENRIGKSDDGYHYALDVPVGADDREVKWSKAYETYDEARDSLRDRMEEMWNKARGRDVDDGEPLDKYDIHRTDPEGEVYQREPLTEAETKELAEWNNVSSPAENEYWSERLRERLAEVSKPIAESGETTGREDTMSR